MAYDTTAGVGLYIREEGRAMMERLPHRIALMACALIVYAGTATARPDMMATITNDIETPFGTYHPVHVNVTPRVPPFAVAPDFSNVCNFENVPRDFTRQDSVLLFENQFTVKWPLIYWWDYSYSQGAPKQMHYIYADATHHDTPIFVTTDAVLHIYHTMFDLFLRAIEERRFVPALTEMLEATSNDISATYASAPDGRPKEAARRAWAYLWVARSLLSESPLTPPGPIAENVTAELALIEAHARPAASPILEQPFIDYSQFVPRGHYTTSETLKRFFKSMMWLGLTPFVSDVAQYGDVARTNTLAAVYITQAIHRVSSASGPAMDLWSRIYDPTVFFVGSSDDPNVRDYRDIGGDVYGSGFLSASPTTLDAGIDQFIEGIAALPGPRINAYDVGGGGAYRSFRLMGQRFIPDSYMFSELVAPALPGDREFPKGLDVMAVLGGDRAFEILDTEYGETSHAGYTERVGELRAEFQALPTDTWGQNLYWNWLYSLMPLLNEKEQGYPTFMQSDAWRDRELVAALGSWAELRHDTILYAKQSGGVTCEPPGPPRSYVEPNPHLYARLLALARFTRNGLESRDLLLEEFAPKLELFESMLDFLLRMSVKELEDTPLTEDDYNNIYTFGEVMRVLVDVPESLRNPGEQDNMAVIADVHTGFTSGQVLEEGVGYPLEIWVIVNEGGNARITRGAVFSYYEFRWPMGDRLTDEKWRDMLDGGGSPSLPGWYASMMDQGAPRISYTDNGSWSIWSHEFDPTSIDAQPDEVVLYPNMPNPFNPETFIRFVLPEPAEVRVDVYDVGGRHVQTLVSRSFPAGDHSIVWRGNDDAGRPMATGTYILRLQAGDAVRSQRMTLMR